MARNARKRISYGTQCCLFASPRPSAKGLPGNKLTGNLYSAATCQFRRRS